MGPSQTWPCAWAVRAVGLLLALMLAPAGCAQVESRTLADLPPPKSPTDYTPPEEFFPNESADPPATAWPASEPDVARATVDVEAGWRNHFLGSQANPEPAWQWIVIHHSGGKGTGNAAAFDALHRAPPRLWDELGYDFVIGNGTGSPDGWVEVGSRWIKQKHGAHCATPSHRYNDFGIGICLVGDFQKDDNHPSPAQWASLLALCRFLCREYAIPPDHILGHRDAQATEGEMTTDCPGKNMDLAWLRRELARGR